jgi:hypothetical protein
VVKNYGRAGTIPEKIKAVSRKIKTEKKEKG